MDKTSKADEVRQEESFKEQLDRIAMQSKQDGQEQQPNTLVEKITEYIPAASKILGGASKEQPQQTAQSGVPGPPHRPDHDDKIEEFVRDQHRSGRETGVPIAGEDN
ncbi:hypothetical protein HRG_003299 [Hirsutella rhossiliensis]|uniref:Uncharacterized protein n=1 Tax=Hirsutella rhossiliensis TaxID=111463 RepID=A0A9P8SJG7_9HYPO|nr:uncharacterized protein HRG_03299 [Hirsutella rhossiliensis]KAH0965283.1 hypothetical protein HRG_03299 [Hirsutella rhossiliensis]